MLKRFLLVLLYMFSPLWIILAFVLGGTYMICTVIPFVFVYLIISPVYYIITGIDPHNQNWYDNYIRIITKPLDYINKI